MAEISVPAVDWREEDPFQQDMLLGVSRTFALTIPQLPLDLYRVVANGYLLCRIADTIEDEPALVPEQKRRFAEQFVEVVAGRARAGVLADELGARLSEHTLATEHELIRQLPRVIRITHGFAGVERDALATCVRVMMRGMADFQVQATEYGLADVGELDRYCYYVAGVVGEMLTRLFCHYSPEIARHRDELMTLAVSFGQGLQMTNILKDVWDDRHRGACWLPQDVFARSGFDIGALDGHENRVAFARGVDTLIGIAHTHLANALRYTLLIPPHETGIRNFCLWALGMAVLTLRKIHRHREFRSSRQVKITRRSVRATVLVSRLCARYDGALRMVFRLSTLGLPRAPSVSLPVPEQAPPADAVAAPKMAMGQGRK